jgi:hypothetical protein
MDLSFLNFMFLLALSDQISSLSLFFSDTFLLCPSFGQNHGHRGYIKESGTASETSVQIIQVVFRECLP